MPGPANAVDVVTPDMKAGEAPPPPEKILVVDDEAGICALVSSILSNHGYVVVATCDPRNAVDLVRAENPVLILADISMPGMDGYALIDALRADPATCGCAVMFMTGRMGFSERMKAFRHGARDFVAKPFAGETLLAKVARVLDDVRASH